MEPRILISDVTLWRVLRDDRSLFRYYQTLFLERNGPAVHGRVIEIGGELKYAHARFFPNASSYTVTNIARDYEQRLDVTAMPFRSDSQDAFVCVSVLAHVQDLFAAANELRRALRPGGTLLLTVPFLFPVTDDSDYWRFSRDAFDVLLEGYDIRQLAHLGGRVSTVVDLLQRPKNKRDRRSVVYKAMAAVIAALLGGFDTLDGYPLGFGVVAVKR